MGAVSTSTAVVVAAAATTTTTAGFRIETDTLAKLEPLASPFAAGRNVLRQRSARAKKYLTGEASSSTTSADARIGRRKGTNVGSGAGSGGGSSGSGSGSGSGSSTTNVYWDAAGGRLSHPPQLRTPGRSPPRRSCLARHFKTSAVRRLGKPKIGRGNRVNPGRRKGRGSGGGGGSRARVSALAASSLQQSLAGFVRVGSRASAE